VVIHEKAVGAVLSANVLTYGGAGVDFRFGLESHAEIFTSHVASNTHDMTREEIHITKLSALSGARTKGDDT
jgi:hypothetical protein